MKHYKLILLAFLAWNASGQNTQSRIENGVWENIYNGDISNDGNWMFYESRYQLETDTLTVQSTKGDVIYKIEKGRSGKFTKNSSYFIVLSKNDSLQIIDLGAGKLSYIENSLSYSFTHDENFLIIPRSKKDVRELFIKNLLSGVAFIVPDVQNFSIHPYKNEVALIREANKTGSVTLLNLLSQKSSILKTSKECGFGDLSWSEKDSYLTFLETSNDDDRIARKIYHYACNRFQNLALANTLNLPDNFRVESNFIEVSKNGDFVFFKGSTIDQDTHVPEGVQIWDTADKWIYPRRKVNKLLKPAATLWSWNPEKDIVAAVTDTTLTEIIKVNEDHVLKYDPLAYEPQYRYVADVDMYLHNLKSGKSELLLKKQRPSEVFIDPNGDHVVFFKEKSWWSYNLKTKRTLNLTEDLPYPFYDEENDRNDRKTSFSRRIKWVENENSILVFDEYDVWRLNLNGDLTQRLTKGREIKRKYRFFVDFANPKKSDQSIVTTEKGVLLYATDKKRNTGYFLYKNDGTLAKIAFGAYMVEDIKWDTNLKYLTYSVQAYDMPPEINLYDTETTINTTLVKSNIDRNLLNWGGAELFEFQMKDGSTSRATLVYPANYDPSQKYPMIVNIYERPTEKMHEFFPISWYQTDGFNPTHYTTDGYFVLQPDIIYEIGNPGKSAHRYVEESIQKALQIAPIDKRKIGLFGFSFGGYESAFITTQTNMFAAAVAGAAVTNLITFYHAINWTTGREEMFRLEDYQMRMGESYYSAKEKYTANSPFHNIENISTPIMLFSGAKDYHIDYNENIRFYLALRRLNKKAQLLLIEGEGHNILDLEKRKYLSKSIKKWFDRYCK